MGRLGLPLFVEARLAGSSLIGSLAVSLGMETAAFKRGAQDATKEMSRLQQRLQTIGQGMSRIGTVMSATITAPFAALLSQAIPAAREAREALGQVEAANRSMGQAAGFSTEQLQEQAGALMALSTFDDDEIMRKVTANLLTFGNVSGEVFERTQRAIVDVSARMGTDLQATTMQLGRALNDPLKGMNALARAGIQFTDQQKAQIRAMVAAGNAAGAQRVMLAELERQFSGSAQAMLEADPTAKLKKQWDSFLETVGELALNVLPPLLNRVTELAAAFNQLDPATQQVAIGAVAVAAALGPLLMVVGPLVPIIGALTTALLASVPAAIGWGAAMVTAFGAAGAAGALSVFMAAIGPALPIIAGLAVALGGAYLAWQNWESIGPMLQELWGWIENTLGPPLQRIVSAASGVLDALWNGPLGNDIRAAIGFIVSFGNVIGEVLGPVAKGVIEALGSIVSTVFAGIERALNAVSALLRGDFTEAWNNIKALVNGIVEGIVDAAWKMVRGAWEAIQDFWRRSQSIVSQGGVAGVTRGIAESARQGGDTGAAAIDVWRSAGIPGGSLASTFITAQMGMAALAQQAREAARETVTGIGQEMARLDAALVEPVRRGKEAAVSALRQMQQDVRSLLDRLFPEVARQNEQAAALRLLEGAGLSPDVFAVARQRLRDEFDETARELRALLARLNPEKERAAQWQRELALIGTMEGGFGGAAQREARARLARERQNQLGEAGWTAIAGPGQIVNEAGEVVDAIDGVAIANDNLAAVAERANRNIVESFANMAGNVLSSLRGMVQSFKGGDIIGGILGLMDTILGIAGMVGGTLGKNASAFGGRGLPKWANGGSGIIGGLGGVDRNLLSLNGSPMAWVSRGERLSVMPNLAGPSNDTGPVRVQIVPSPYFDAVVSDRASAVAAPMAAAAGVGGSAMAQRGLMRRASRAIP